MISEVVRDAVMVLDTIGWLPDPAAETINVSIPDAHVTQLRELRTDLGLAVLDYLDIRADIDTTDDLAEVDDFINRYHRESSDLLTSSAPAAEQATRRRWQRILRCQRCAVLARML